MLMLFKTVLYKHCKNLSIPVSEIAFNNFYNGSKFGRKWSPLFREKNGQLKHGYTMKLEFAAR